MGKRSATWRVGGILLGVCGVLRLGGAQMVGSPVVTQTLIDVVWALGILVFAFGFRRAGSVVARRPLGLTALIVLALAPLVVNLSYNLAPVQVMSSEPSTGWLAFAVSWTGSAVSIAVSPILPTSRPTSDSSRARRRSSFPPV